MGVKHALLLSCLLIASCSERPTTPETTTPDAPSARTVVVTDPQIACLVGPLLPEGAGLTTIAPDDPTAHASGWAPDREEARALRNADLVVSAGGGADFWLDIIGLRDDRLLRLADAYPDDLIPIGTDTHSHGPGGEHSHTVYAPRPWLMPELADRAITAIGARLRADGIAETVDDNALRRDLATIIASLPNDATDTLLVTTRDAWRYPARRINARIVVFEPGADAINVRVEVSASNAQRVILAGDIDAGAVRDAIGDAGIEIVDIPLSDDPCGWLDALTALGVAFTDRR